MRLLAAALFLLSSSDVARAQSDPPMSVEDFEAFVEGRTMDTHDQTGRYGVETFLPGRRAIWRDAQQCLEGSWRPVGDQICFKYDTDPFQYCWTYHDRGDWMMAWLDGDRSSQPIMLYPSKEVVTCEGYFGV
ncbi:MAG: hypothetical protein ACKO1H_10345 [Tabrizicola sp.]